MAEDLKECNRLDVLDLTHDLRHSDLWRPLRNKVTSKGLDLSRLALPLYMEDECGNEYGLIVSQESLYEFQFNEDRDELIRWYISESPEGIYCDAGNEVEWTREMLKNGEI